jgi:hypothetical protein
MTPTIDLLSRVSKRLIRVHMFPYLYYYVVDRSTNHYVITISGVSFHVDVSCNCFSADLYFHSGNLKIIFCLGLFQEKIPGGVGTPSIIWGTTTRILIIFGVPPHKYKYLK